MGTLRPAHVAAAVAFVLGAVVLLFAGPLTSSSASSTSKPVKVGSPTAASQAWTADLATYVARLDRTLVVFGDSISARYNDVTGDDLQGYWSMVADDLGAEPRVYAEGGAGFVNHGLEGCVGHTFGEQLATPRVKELVRHAGALLVEGGRTDTQTCAGGGDYALIPDWQLRDAVDRFFAKVARLRGAHDRCTFVLVPWGPAGLADNRERVKYVVSQAVQRYGFTFIYTDGLLTDETTIEDRVHPTYWGNRSLANAVLDGGDARSCIQGVPAP